MPRPGWTNGCGVATWDWWLQAVMVCHAAAGISGLPSVGAASSGMLVGLVGSLVNSPYRRNVARKYWPAPVPLMKAASCSKPGICGFGYRARSRWFWYAHSSRMSSGVDDGLYLNPKVGAVPFGIAASPGAGRALLLDVAAAVPVLGARSVSGALPG